MENSDSVDCDSDYYACNFTLFQPSEKDDNWLLVVGGAVGKSKYNANDGVSMTFQESPMQYATPSLIFSPPMAYIFVRYSAALEYEGFAADMVRKMHILLCG